MGLELSSEAHTLELLCDFSLQNEIDIGGITESTTHWENKKGYLQMKRITTKFWKKDKIITSELETKGNRTHKPG